MTKHHVLIAADPPTGGWQAWCRPCGWHGPVRRWTWEARADAEQHKEDGPDGTE